MERTPWIKIDDNLINTDHIYGFHIGRDAEEEGRHFYIFQTSAAGRDTVFATPDEKFRDAVFREIAKRLSGEYFIAYREQMKIDTFEILKNLKNEENCLKQRGD